MISRRTGPSQGSKPSSMTSQYGPRSASSWSVSRHDQDALGRLLAAVVHADHDDPGEWPVLVQ